MDINRVSPKRAAADSATGVVFRHPRLGCRRGTENGVHPGADRSVAIADKRARITGLISVLQSVFNFFLSSTCIWICLKLIQMHMRSIL